MKILFVCLGNICRSPLAEAIFKVKIAQRKLDDRIEVDSAGTSNFHIGGLADSRSRANAKLNNLVVDHVARQIKNDDLRVFDYIVAMDKKNLQNIFSLPLAEDNKCKIFLMRSFDKKSKTKDSEEDVPDPYFGGDEGFQKVFDILDRACENFLDYLVERHSVLKTVDK